MKNILIFYASYGGGHLNAAKSIYECISNHYENNSIELIDCMKYVNKTVEKLSTVAYREAAKKAPWVWGKIYSDSQKGPLAHLSSRSNKIMAIKLLRLLREKNPDLIISTHPFSSQMCSYLKRKGKITAKIATIMTDFAPHDQWLVGSDFTDYFFVANSKMKDYLISTNIPQNKVFITGIPLSSRFLEKYDRKEILAKFELEDGKKNILFFGGGEFGLGKSRTFEILDTLIKTAKDMQIIAISGKNEKMKTKFDEIVKNNYASNRVKILKFTNQVPELMSISDVVVTKPGGMTTTESLACGLPMIIINPIPGQEEENAEFLEKKKVGIWIKKNDDVSKILHDLFSNPNQLNEMKNNALLIGHPNSTKDICDILLNS
ncbi:MAG: glycosyltransferase [Clostridia bacterium]|nr:glycosyltransferase [Clostridia bacterium]